MKWFTEMHAKRFRRSRNSVGEGAVYQSRYFSRGIADIRDFISILRYVEANALKDGAVARAEYWPWCSAWCGEGVGVRVPVDDSPIPRPSNWLQILNEC